MLSVENRIFVANLVVMDTEKRDYFFSLPDEERSVMAAMIVKGNI